MGQPGTRANSRVGLKIVLESWLKMPEDSNVKFQRETGRLGDAVGEMNWLGCCDCRHDIKCPYHSSCDSFEVVKDENGLYVKCKYKKYL